MTGEQWGKIEILKSWGKPCLSGLYGEVLNMSNFPIYNVWLKDFEWTWKPQGARWNLKPVNITGLFSLFDCRQSLQCTVYWKQSCLVIWPSRYCQVILHINAHDLKDIWFVTHHAMFIYHLFPFFLICREVLSLVKL